MKLRMGVLWGLAGGILLGFVNWAGYYMGYRFDYYTQEKIGYTSMVLSCLLMIPAILSIKRHQQGALTYGQAFVTGLYTTLAAALVYGIVAAIQFMDPDFVKHFMTIGREAAEQSGPDAVAEFEKMAPSFSPSFVFVFTFFTVVFIGLVIAALVSLVVKSKGKTEVYR